MSTVSSAVFVPQNNREIVAGNVRAELSAKKVRVSHLPTLIGGSRELWRRRITQADVALDVDDLGKLADLLGVDMAYLVRGTKMAPTGGAVRAKLPELDSNQQPAG